MLHSSFARGLAACAARPRTRTHARVPGHFGSGVARTGAAVALCLASAFLAAAPAQAQEAMPMPQATRPATVTPSMAALYSAMESLWSQHMEWTYEAIVAFANQSGAFDATAQRLLQNQVDIGNAIKPYYGAAAGDQLAQLLTQHIDDFVAILQDAQSGNSGQLASDEAAAYANAQEIADFLAGANSHLSHDAISSLLKSHIDMTIQYATAALQHDYSGTISVYDQAEAMMMNLADTLSSAIIAQFPTQFTD